MPNITREQYEIMISKGLKPQEITEIAKQRGYGISFDEPEAEGIVGDIQGRITETLKVGERFQKGEQTLPETVLQTGGQIAGGLTDIIMKGISAITPDIIEKPIQAGLEKVAQTETAQKAIQGYQSWAEKNPRAAADLEAVVNIASLYPAAKTAQGIGKGALKTTQYVSKTAVGASKTAIKALTPESKSIMQRVARISKGKQASFEQLAGENIGSYLDKRGIYGNIENISSKLYNRFETSKGVADDALSLIKGNYKSKPVETAIKELLQRETRISSPGALSKDFKRVRELFNKYNKEGLTMPEVNQVKRLYERNVKLDFIKQNLPEKIARANTIDSALRNWQFTQAEKAGFKNLPQINKETQLAKRLLDDLGKEYAGVAGNNAITLTDWIVLSGGDPTAIGLFLTKKGLSSRTIQSKIAQIFSKSEKIGLPKAEFGMPQKDITDFLKSIQDFSKQQSLPK